MDNILSEKLVMSCGCEFHSVGPPRYQGGPPQLDFYPMDPTYINWNCPRTWSLFASGKTQGIFQLEKILGKVWSKKSKPESLDDVSALMALLRPGVLKAKDENNVSMTEHFVRRKNGEEEIEAFDESIADILADTYGIATFQEQTIFIARKVAGFNLVEADLLRKAMGAKDAAKMAQVKKMFLEKAKQVGILSEEKAAQLFDYIEKSNRYSFNRCFFGQERLKNERGPHKFNPTIKEMYEIRQSHKRATELGHLSLYKKWKMLGNYGRRFSMFEDGRVRPNNVIDIIKQPDAEVFIVTTESGKTISVTGNHNFPTPKGKLMLDELSVGDELYVVGEYEKTTTKYNWSQVTKEERLTTQLIDSTGRKNHFFTNGEYKKFKINKSLLPNYCAICGQEHHRIEIHHIDGNREHNELQNLIKLCPSCHKKEEYKAGRTRKGEKGYLVAVEKIISIESMGIQEVYDITMAAPAHNVVVESGIIASNSHSVCYGNTSYITAYLKSHFTPEFFLLWLIKSEDKADRFEEINNLVEDAKLFDIEVLPPDITSPYPGFHIIDKNTIQFGFLNAKGIGEKAIDKLVAFSKSIDKDWGLGRFIIEALDSISQKHLKVLTEIGALRNIFNESRAEIIRQIELYDTLTATEQKKLIKLVREKDVRGHFIDFMPAFAAKGPEGICHKEDRVEYIKSLFSSSKPIEDTLQYIVEKEKELLGIALSMHQADELPPERINTTCKEWVKSKKKDAVIGVEVNDVIFQTIKTGKNAGKQMATLTVSDGTAKMVCKAFSDATEAYERLFRVDNLLILSGNRLPNDDTFSIKKAWDANK